MKSWTTGYSRCKSRDQFLLDAVVALPRLLVGVVLAAQLDFVVELLEVGLDSHGSPVAFNSPV